ncbi:hypothetical protein BH10PLA2_BH10PLA2_26550 [soil metagenome]
MFTNRISSYLSQQAETVAPVIRPQAFTPCPQALFPGEWAMSVYAIAYAQAKQAVEVRRVSRIPQECWN